MPTKILVIDDDTALTELFTVTMRGHGFEVITANSGNEGLAKLETTNPDAVMLDLIMHDCDGWAICKTIRATKKTMPILILSALGDSGTISAALDAGADDYLVKPVASAVLIARINTLIRRANTEKKAVGAMKKTEPFKNAFQG